MSVRFNGSSGYGRSLTTLNTSLITSACFVRLNALPTAGLGGPILAFSDGVASSTFDKALWLTTAGGLRWYVFDGAGKTVSGPTLTVGKWYHVAGVNDGTTSYIIVDGVIYGTVAAAGSYTSYTVNNIFAGGGTILPGDTPATARYLSCDIANVGVWNTNLDMPEIKALAAGFSPRNIRPGSVRWSPNLGAGPLVASVDGPHGISLNGGWTDAHDDYPASIGSTYGASEVPDILSGEDSATIYIDIQVSSADVAEYVDSATVLVDIQPSGVATAQYADSATVLVDLQVDSFECHIKWQPTFTGEFSQCWTGASSRKWSSTLSAGWSGILSYGTVADEC